MKGVFLPQIGIKDQDSGKYTIKFLRKAVKLWTDDKSQ